MAKSDTANKKIRTVRTQLMPAVKWHIIDIGKIGVS